ISLGGGNYTLTGMVPGLFTTTADSHSNGVVASGAIQVLAAPSQALNAFVGGVTGQYFFAINCPIAAPGTPAFEVGCNPLGFSVFFDGSFQSESSTLSHMYGPGGL